MRCVTFTACLVALLAVSACGRSPVTRAATGGLGGAAVGTVVGGPVVGTAAGATAGATLGAATAPD
jgi:osmotically inducible lipoprotein OsmB